MSNRKLSADSVHAQLRRLDQKANVAGYIVLNASGDHIGTVRLSYPRDGAGKLVAMAADWTAERPHNTEGKPDFTNWTPWQYGWANGGGYDKASAALSNMTIGGVRLIDDGHGWHDQLRAAGFRVIQAV